MLRPYQAVAWAAFFNFVAFAIFKLNVAATVGKGILAPEFVDTLVISCALGAAIIWDLITWYYGLPTSSSHALIGGMIGAGMAKAGTAPLVFAGIWKTLVFIVISPLLGLMLGALIMVAVSWIFFRRSPRSVDQWFRRLQLLSSALYSIGHGSNDAQKTMGLIWLMLICAGGHSAHLGGSMGRRGKHRGSLGHHHSGRRSHGCCRVVAGAHLGLKPEARPTSWEA